MKVKKDLEDLLDEIKDRMDYYLRKADDPNFVEIEQSCVGHYCELKEMKERIEEIVYGEDK